jgi:signal transduction histidine kinase
VESPSQALELRRLADEHAALHRVASLVARSDVGADRIVAVATEEVGRLLGVESATMVRYGDDGTAEIVGGWSADPARQEPVGLAVQLDDGTALAQVWQTGLPSRVDDYRPLRGPQVGYLRHTLGLQAAVAAPIMLRGRLWGAVSAATVRPEPFPPGAEHRLAGFTELLAQALANSEAARELAASRHRLVEAGDAERRRLERNLHDGAQQRLVTLSLSLGLLERNARLGDPPSAADLAAARAELADALEELRELARGLHPAVLADRGLRGALPALAARSPLVVDVDADVDRVPEPVEVAAYFVASEALANAAKHGRATRAEVVARREDGDLHLTVSDDGVGGAVLGSGSGTGLQGLADRVEALGGRFDLRSRAGEGTCLDVRLPLAAS